MPDVSCCVDACPSRINLIEGLAGRDPPFEVPMPEVGLRPFPPRQGGLPTPPETHATLRWLLTAIPPDEAIRCRVRAKSLVVLARGGCYSLIALAATASNVRK
jgi:hypothetical protein